jgi:hypothetical protein
MQAYALPLLICSAAVAAELAATSGVSGRVFFLGI